MGDHPLIHQLRVILDEHARFRTGLECHADRLALTITRHEGGMHPELRADLLDLFRQARGCLGGGPAPRAGGI